VLERVRAMPGVSSAGATLNKFIPGLFYLTRVDIEDKPAPDGQPHIVHFRRASPGYFETMRIPMLRGREFAETDRIGRPEVAIVSRQFAEKFWPGEDPIGKRILRRSAPPKVIVTTVVGMAGDVRDVALERPPAPTVYIPYGQNTVAVAPVSLVVRTRGAPLDSAAALRAAVLSVDPQQPIDSVTTLEQFLADSLGTQRFRSTLLLVLGGIGLMLAALGVYGMTSRAVEERTAELGVRLAFGATPRSLVRLVVWQSMRAVLAGLASGLALSAAAGLVLLRALPQLEQSEAWVAAPALLALTAVSVIAAIVPAWRALALDPILALRGE
jgi:putative ABC transport system permease protein